jgi:hypothetical protein
MILSRETLAAEGSFYVISLPAQHSRFVLLLAANGEKEKIATLLNDTVSERFSVYISRIWVH